MKEFSETNPKFELAEILSGLKKEMDLLLDYVQNNNIDLEDKQEIRNTLNHLQEQIDIITWEFGL